MRRTIQALLPLLGMVGVLALAHGAAGPLDLVRKYRTEVGPRPHADYTQAIPGSAVKFDMVAIPGGVYLRGSPRGEKGRKEDEGPQHPVRIRPFWMGKCEATWDEFDAYQKTAPLRAPRGVDAVTRPTPSYADETHGLGREGQPVICITHHAAMEYCRWLSQKTGRAYRLPTEAEWEWACRAGTTTAYSFGGDVRKLGEYAWFEGNAKETTHKVGKKKPNPWGLYDMHGNAAEWCLDHYREEEYRRFRADRLALAPFVAPTEKRFRHVVRGGSWMHGPEMARSAARMGSEVAWIRLDPGRPRSMWWLTSAEFVGFRVVRAVDEAPALRGLKSKVSPEID